MSFAVCFEMPVPLPNPGCTIATALDQVYTIAAPEHWALSPSVLPLLLFA